MSITESLTKIRMSAWKEASSDIVVFGQQTKR